MIALGAAEGVIDVEIAIHAAGTSGGGRTVGAPNHTWLANATGRLCVSELALTRPRDIAQVSELLWPAGSTCSR